MAAAASGAWAGVAGGALTTLRRFLGARVATLADRAALVAAVARSHRRTPPPRPLRGLGACNVWDCQKPLPLHLHSRDQQSLE